MKTVEQKQHEAKVYLQKTSQHIFMNGKGEYWALVDKGDGKYSWITGTETRDWETINKYEKYYTDKKAFYKGVFFPVHLLLNRENVRMAVRRSRVDPAFLELIEKTRAGN
jgi:hypothetical protein